MKRLLLLLLTAAMLVLFTAALSYATETETVTVTFTMPENHHYVYVHYIYPDEHITKEEHRPKEFWLVPSLTLEVEKGHVLTVEDVEPFTVHCPDTYLNIHKYCRVTMTGWDRDPVGMEITEDTEFFAQMSEDACTVTVCMDKGYYTAGSDDYESFDVEVDKGYTITEDDVERFTNTYQHLGLSGGRTYYDIVGFTPEPLGMVVEEDVTIAANAKRRIYIEYYMPDFETGEYSTFIGWPDHYAYEGESYPREELMDIYGVLEEEADDVIEAYWDVTDEELSALYPTRFNDFHIYGKVTLRGDCNQDILRNTADAVAVLRYAAKLHTFTDVQEKAADMNRDDTVNTADAVLMLQYAAGLSEQN